MTKIENYYNGCLVVSTYGEAESHEVFCDGVSERERELIKAEGVQATLIMQGVTLPQRIGQLKTDGQSIGRYPTLAAAVQVTRGREPALLPPAEAATEPDETDTDVIET